MNNKEVLTNIRNNLYTLNLTKNTLLRVMKEANKSIFEIPLSEKEVESLVS